MKTKLPIIMAGFLTLLAISCTKDSADKDKITISEDEMILYSGEKRKINAESSLPLTYESEDLFHAKVSADGVVEGMYVGETTITITNGVDTKRVLVNVNPRHHLYEEPKLIIGATVQDIEKRYGAPDKKDEKSMLYNHWKGAKACSFLLKNGRTAGAGILISSAYASELGDFLAERYFMIDADMDNYRIMMIDGVTKETASMIVGTQIMNMSYIMVAYMPIDLTKVGSDNLEASFREQFMSLIN